MKMQDASKLPKAPYVLYKETILSEVMENYPKAGELLSLYDLHCANCFINSLDTLENGAKLHGMSDVEIEKMIDEINIELKKDL